MLDRIQGSQTDSVNQSTSLDKIKELELKQFIKELNPNEKAVIIKRYGLDGKDPMTLSEIGSILGFSKERIRQLESRALNQLKKNLTYSNYYVDLVA